MATTSMIKAPLIRRLTIDHFRGIERLEWHPAAGVNVILGGGDVGKTTILDAIGLLLHPTNMMALSEADYWGREVEKGFCIEAVMSVPEDCGVNQQTKNAWPWEWDAGAPVLPKVDNEPSSSHVIDPVYRLRVCGKEDFDVAFEVLQPDDSVDHFSVALRRRIGLIRLGGDDRNDRDLRLVQGSALERLLSDRALRSRLGQTLAENDIEQKLKSEAQETLKTLDKAFEQHGLPYGLSLGLTGGQGFSLTALIGLTADRHDVKLPLVSWGAGTRRLAALQIAASHQGESPITLVDEIERGLEPYRQRILMDNLEAGNSQVFLTTHSSASIGAAVKATLWHLDTNGIIGKVPRRVISYQSRDPEMLLSRITIIAEGPSEMGFIENLFLRAIEKALLDLGIWITDGGGNDNTLKMLEDLSGAGFEFGGFADDEGKDPDRWASAQKKLGKLLFRWPSGCLEENIIKLVPVERLEEFIQEMDGRSGDRRRTLASRLGIDGKDFSSIKAKATDLTQLIIEAATGTIPSGREGAEKAEKREWKAQAGKWFKSVEGGHELATKVFSFELWPKLESQLLPFLNAVRAKVSLPPILKLPL